MMMMMTQKIEELYAMHQRKKRKLRDFIVCNTKERFSGKKELYLCDDTLLIVVPRTLVN